MYRLILTGRNYISLILLAKIDSANCLEKDKYDEIAALDGKCGNIDKFFVCVCNTDLCNDGKEDDESGVEMVVPQFAMMFLLSISVYYFTI